MDAEIDHELNAEEFYSKSKFNQRQYDFINKKEAKLAADANKAFIEKGSKSQRTMSGSASAPVNVPRVGAMVPRQPIDFEVTRVTTTSIEFFWNPPIISGGDIISNYEINYSIRLTTAVGKKKTYTHTPQPPFKTTCCIHHTPVHTNGALLTGLQAGVEYAQITVRCMNSVGWSRDSKEIEAVQMPEIEAPSAPCLLMFDGDEDTKITSFSFSLMWNAPMHSGGIDVTHYEVTYYCKVSQ